MTPTLPASRGSLPPEGAAPPWGGPAAVPTPLLEVKNLRVSFGGREVVHGIDFHIHAGEKLALVGESGSGKTVSALALLRLVQNADISGQALLQGRDLLALSERELRGVRGDERVQGHGIGLSVVEDILSAYHGKLAISRSTPPEFEHIRRSRDLRAPAPREHGSRAGRGGCRARGTRESGPAP